jgi:hypothetical protein
MTLALRHDINTLAAAETGRGTHPVSILPNKKTPPELRSLCRSYTEEAIRTIAGIMTAGQQEASRIRAAEILLDRGWGRAVQPVASDPDGPLIVEIIQRVRENKT